MKKKICMITGANSGLGRTATIGFALENLKNAVGEPRRLKSHPESGPFEISNDTCPIFKDPSGNQFAIFQYVRPSARELTHANTDNPRAAHN